MKERKLRVGVLGAGGISKAHFEGWKKQAECEVVAVTDANLDAAKKRAEEFSIPAVEANAAKMMARKDIDVIDICVPNMFHKPYTLAALKAGKHVLCEKPLALTPVDVDAMIAASKKSKKKLMCAQHMRFDARSAALKQYITEHSLGDVYYSRAWYLRRRQLPARAGFIFKSQSGGGPCIDVGVHILDLTLFLMNNFEPVSVSGISVAKLAKRPESWTEWNWGAENWKKAYDVEDFAAGFIRFKNGAVMNLECSWMLNIKPRSENRVDLCGTLAGAKWPDCEIFSHTGRDFADTKLEVRDAAESAYAAEIRGFSEAVMGNKPVPVLPEQTRAVIAILDGLYRSQELGREVKI